MILIAANPVTGRDCTDIPTTRHGWFRKETSRSGWGMTPTRPAPATSSSPLPALHTSSPTTARAAAAWCVSTPTRRWSPSGLSERHCTRGAKRRGTATSALRSGISPQNRPRRRKPNMQRNIRTLVIAVVIAVACAGLAYAGSSPTVSTGSANVGTTSATLQGVVNPQGSGTSYQFEYGLTNAYGVKTKAASAGSSTKARAVHAVASQLIPGTVYHFRLDATNKFGTSEGRDHVFRTAGHPPAAASTGPVTGLGKTGVTLTGTVDPNGETTAWTFQYGLTTAYGSQVFGGVLPASNVPSLVSWPLVGIEPRGHVPLQVDRVSRPERRAPPGRMRRSSRSRTRPPCRGSGRGPPRERPSTGRTCSRPRPASAARRRFRRRSSALATPRSNTSSATGGCRSTSPPMQPNCTFSGTTSFNHLPHSGKHRPKSETLKVEIHFRGNGYLAPAAPAPRRSSSDDSRSVGEPVNEPQPGPDLVDRAHLVVHEPGRQAELADDAVAEIGRYPRRPLRPRDSSSPPAGSSAARSAGSRRSSAARSEKNATITSSGPRARRRTARRPAAARRARPRIRRARVQARRAASGLIPNLRGSGVPG